MIDDWARNLYQRHRVLGVLAIVLVVTLFVFDSYNNIVNLPQGFSKFFVPIVLLALLVTLVYTLTDSKGRYSSKDKRLARAMLILVVQLMALWAWNRLLIAFPYIETYETLARILLGVGTGFSLILFLLAYQRDKQPLPYYKILICELGEGAQKETPTDRTVTHLLLDNLRNKMVLEQVQIDHVEEVVLDYERALTLGENAKAVAVVFGFYTRYQSNVLLNIKFQVVKTPTFYHPISTETRALPLETLERGELELFLARDLVALTAFLVGLFEYSNSEYEKALMHFQSASEKVSAKKDPTSNYSLKPEAIFLYMGVSFYQLGDHLQAKDSFIRSIESNPNLAKSLHNLGVIYFNEGDNNRAIEYFNQATEIDSKLWIAYRNRAFAYSAIGNYETAEIDLRTYFEHNSQDIEAIMLFAECMSNGDDHEGAAKAYLKIRELDEKHNIAVVLAAKEYAICGDTKTTIRLLHSLEKHKEKEVLANAYEMIGNELYKNQQYSLADELYSKAISLESEDLPLIMKRARVRLEYSNFQGAQIDAEDILRKDQDCSEAHSLLGDIFVKSGLLRDAVECYSMAIQTSSEGSPSYYFNRGYASLKLRDFDVAITDFSTFLSTSEPSQSGKGFFPRAMAKLGKLEYGGAIEDLEAALKVYPNSTSIKNALSKAYFSYACYLEEKSEQTEKIIELLKNAVKADNSIIEHINRHLSFASLSATLIDHSP